MYRNILLPVDPDDEGSWRAALPTAAAIAKAFGARLHVLTVVPDFGMSAVASQFPDDYLETAKEQVLNRLEDLIANGLSGEETAERIVSSGSIYRQILRTADEMEADLIVMAAHHPELRDFLLGPNAARVVRHARCSVMVVRE